MLSVHQHSIFVEVVKRGTRSQVLGRSPKMKKSSRFWTLATLGRTKNRHRVSQNTSATHVSSELTASKHSEAEENGTRFYMFLHLEGGLQLIDMLQLEKLVTNRLLTCPVLPFDIIDPYVSPQVFALTQYSLGPRVAPSFWFTC